MDHVVVVGGSSGLGLATVKRFLARGFFVTVLSRRPPSMIELSHQLRHIPTDLETLDDFLRIEEFFSHAIGKIRYLVFTQRFRGTGDPWMGEMKVGLYATKLLIEGLLPLFCSTGDRSIVAVSSVYANFIGSSQPVGYHVVKAGLNALIRYYSWSLGRRGIRANSIMPLSYVKEETRQHFEGKFELASLYSKFVPLGRMGDVRENVDAVDFLCSEKSSFITGQNLFIDGGTSVVWQEEVANSVSMI